MKNIAVFGAGYVGLTSAVIFANSGYNVTLIEISPSRLKKLEDGKSFFYESGVNELLAQALSAKNLSVTNNSEQALKNAEVVFSCVGTPDNPDGSSNLQYVFDVAESVIKQTQDNVIFVQKSTVPVGTGQKIEALFKKHSRKISYASNPEFLREGTAVQDSLWFDRVVVGSNNTTAANLVLDIYRNVEKNKLKLAKLAGVKPKRNTPSLYVKTSRNSAELTKVTANAFLALKISFANSIAKLADAAGADVVEVMDAVGSDRRIGRAFLNAGRGYGGGCFPKDVSGLISSAEDYGVDLPIMTATTDVNESMPGYIANKANNSLGELKDKRVAVLGLAFKAGTSDARKSPGVKLANILDKSGALVKAYDPHASQEAKQDLRSNIIISDSIQDAVKGADAVFVTVDWPEFKTLDFSWLKSKMKGNIFIDAVNAFEADELKSCGIEYIGVGRS